MITGHKRALILLNASAGTGRAGQNTWTIIRRFAENGFEPIVYPIVPGTDLISEKLLAAYDGEIDTVLCCGGDGTLNHVIEGMMRMVKRPRLAYLPTGSTNDFARTLGIPFEFEKALDAALQDHLFRYDVGTLNGRFFNYIAAFGAFSAISYDTGQELKNILGHAAYIVSAVSELYEHMSFSRRLRIEADDFSEEADYIFGAVCNSAYVAGFSVFRDLDVHLDDGKMELLLIKTPKTAADLQGIFTAFQKGTFDHPYLTFRHISSVRILSDEPVAWTVDGEYGGSHRETAIEVRQQAISILRKAQ
ncbi:MAG: YegS/Rv2252/BmrU family lipid kinase [Anaerolineaceae bacterium]|nr:YegS/Rv2252/BmrU family lipid kinase [Anaerolineaceae bacterium]